MHDYLTLVTAPAAEPLSSADVKLNLRIDTTDEDDTTDRLIATARRTCENWLTRRLINSTWDYVLPCFPGNSLTPIVIPFPNLSSVTIVTYFDEDNSSTTWSSSLYSTVTPAGDNADKGWVVPIVDGEYPATASRLDAVTIRHVAGYGSAETDVPDDIQTGMHLLISHLFENREAVMGSQSELPMGVRALWDDYVSEW